MLGLGLKTISGNVIRSIVKSGLQLWYKADKTQAPLGEEQIVNGNFEVGPELIINKDFTVPRIELLTNGDFATDLTGWANSSSDTFEWVSSFGGENGNLHVVTSADNRGASQLNAYKLNVNHVFTARLYIVSGGVFFGRSNNKVGDTNYTTTGEWIDISEDFTPTVDTKLRVHTSGAGEFYLTNISVKEFIPGYKTQIPSGQVVEVVDDKLHIKYDSSKSEASTGVFQSVLVEDKSYTTTIDVASVTGTFKVQAGNVNHVINSTGIKTFTNVAANENLFIVRVSNPTDFEATINSISVKQNNPNDSWGFKNSELVSSSNGVLRVTNKVSGGNNNGGPFQNIGLIVGRKYEVSATLKLISSDTSSNGTYTVFSSTSSGSNQDSLYTGGPLVNGGDAVTETFIFTHTAPSSGGPNVSIQFSSNEPDAVFETSNVSIREITNSIQDKSSNSNDGNLYSGIALEFDGAEDHVRIADDPKLDFGTGDFTLAGWVNCDNLSGDQRIFDKRDGTTGYTLYKGSSNNFLLEIDDGGAEANEAYDFGTGSAIAVDRWYRVVLSVDRDVAPTMYIDGKFISSPTTSTDGNTFSSISSASIDSASDLFIGADADAGDGLYWHGMMSDVQFYKKAWTISDVEFDYNNPDFDVFDDNSRPEVLGVELVTNGNFNTDDTSSWSGFFDSFTFVTDHYNLQRTAGNGRVRKLLSNTLTIGNTYVVEIVAKASVNQLIKVGVTNSSDLQTELTNYTATSVYQSFKHTFIATSNTTHAILWNATVNSNVDYKSCSIKEITTHKAEIQPTDCNLLLRMNEGAGARVYDAAPVLGADLFTNGDFSAARTELITDADFSQGNDFWSTETGWTLDASEKTASYNGSLPTNALIQNRGVIATGQAYILSFTVANYESGTVVASLSGGALTGNTPDITANGDYSFTLIATGGLCLFRSTSRFKGSIKNISLKQSIPNWTAGAGWSQGVGKISRTAQSVSTSASQSISFTSGKSYVINYTLDVSAGAFKVRLSGGTVLETTQRNSSATYSEVITATANHNTLNLRAVDGTFVGSISNLSVKEIKPSNAYSYVDGDGDTDLWVYQQPYIPQIAMSSYSSKMVFNNSVGEFINCASNSSIDNIFDGGGTWSAWFSAESDGGGSVGTIISKSQVRIRTLADDNNDTTIQFLYTFNGDNGTWTCPTTAVLLNKINHIAVTYDNSSVSNNPVMYINGTSQTVTRNTAPTGTRDTDAGSSFIIGNSVPTTTAQNFDGFIDEVSVFKSILTQDEVQEIFNSGTVLNQRLHSKYNLDEKVTNGDFSQIGSELITNGDFSAARVEEITDGTFQNGFDEWSNGSSWSVANNVATLASSDNATNSTLTASDTLVATKTYAFTYTITNFTSGGLALVLGNVSIPSTNGTQTFIFTGQTVLSFKRKGGATALSISNISVKEVIPSWRSSGTVSETGGVVTLGPSSAALAFQESVFENGKTYTVTIDVTSISVAGQSGDKEIINNDGTVLYVISSIGVQQFTFTHAIANTNLLIRARNNSVYSFTSISVKESLPNWTNSTTYPWVSSTRTSSGVNLQTSGSSAYKSFFQRIGAITAGKSYKISFTAVRTSGTMRIGIETAPIGSSIGYQKTITASEVVEDVFTATATNSDAVISFWGTNSAETNNWFIDNVSVKEIGLIAYWRNNGANTWHDLSLNSNDGAVNATYPELIANGTFTGDDGATPASWTASASNSTLTIDTNRIKVTLDSGVTFGNAHQSQVVKAGITYEFKVDIISKSSGVAARIDRTATGADAITGGIGSVGNNQTVQFTATEDATYHIQLVVTGDGANAVFDNVSLKQVKPVTLKLQEVPFFKKDTFGFPMNNVREKGINLDGTSFVEAADSASISPTSAITVQCWIKCNAENDKGLVAKWKTGATDYMLYKTNTRFKFYIGTNNLSCSDDLPTTGWVNIAGTYDGSSIKTFINGVQSSTSSLTGSIPNGVGPLEIGRYKQQSNKTYSETIDDVKIYDRALTAAEILKNYKVTKVKHKDNTSIWSDDYANILISGSGGSGSTSSGSGGSGSGSSGGGGY